LGNSVQDFVVIMSIDIIPDGFELMGKGGPFEETNGPFYVRQNQDGGLEFGFVSAERHENPNGVLHGGMLYTFADHFAGYAIVRTLGRGCATVSLTGEFLSSAYAGKWIEGRAEILRQTMTLAFIRTTVSCEGELLFHGSGVWKLFRVIAKSR
jgi:uncharacterized protein (TIGR00369 family)